MKYYYIGEKNSWNNRNFMNFLGEDQLFVYLINYTYIFMWIFRIAQRLFEFLNQIFEYVSSRAKSCSGLCVYIIFENFFFVCLLFSVFWINCFFTFYFQYIHFDMARSRKRDDTKDNDTIVMAKLAEIGNLSRILKIIRKHSTTLF